MDSKVTALKPQTYHEDIYRSLLENNNNVIYKINTMGEITYISPTIKLLTGYDSNEVIGRHISKFIIPEDYPLVQERMSSIYKGNKAPIEFRIVYKDGEIRYARTTSLTDIEGGKLKGLIGIITDITELRYKENDLLLTRKALDSTSNPALLTDLNGKEVLYQNKAFCRLSGYSQKDINEAGGARVLYHCPAVAFGVYSTIIKGESWKGELDLKTKDGRSVPVHLHTSLVMSNRKPIGCFGVFVDMTEQRKLEEERQAAYQKLYDTIEFLPDPTFVVDKDRRVVEWNRALELITGRTKEEMLGRDDYSVPFYGKKRPTLVDLVLNPELVNKNYYDEIIRKERYLIGEGYAFGYRGKVKYFRGTASAIYNRNGEIIGAIESMRDISERKEITEQLKRYALYDSLTGLYNRNYFQEELSRRDKFKTAGIITCDIDGLKLVNDTLGHEKGNSMLTEAAAIIKNCFTESNIVARISGDEFAAVFYNVTEKEIEAACNRLRGMVKERNSMHEDMPLSLSVGYAVDDNTTNLEELFGLAENNMYREKLHRSKSGKSAVVQTLMKTLKEKDFITEGHAGRLQDLVIALAHAISLPEYKIPDLRLLAQFHDIGKVAVPDSVLMKPKPLSKKEIDVMRRHSEIGYRIAMASPDLAPIAEWILKHHEWWDGSGYPLGLKGEEIPLECRILAIADAYDAITSDRPYRKARSKEEAIEELRRFSGRQFVPELVEKFIEII